MTLERRKLCIADVTPGNRPNDSKPRVLCLHWEDEHEYAKAYENVAGYGDLFHCPACGRSGLFHGSVHHLKFAPEPASRRA